MVTSRRKVLSNSIYREESGLSEDGKSQEELKQWLAKPGIISTE